MFGLQCSNSRLHDQADVQLDQTKNYQNSKVTVQPPRTLCLCCIWRYTGNDITAPRIHCSCHFLSSQHASVPPHVYSTCKAAEQAGKKTCNKLRETQSVVKKTCNAEGRSKESKKFKMSSQEFHTDFLVSQACESKYCITKSQAWRYSVVIC